ncbi:helicase associated domain-containing protein [Persicobacter psychrovividus]|uniref:Helicase-associated domain-containing protein n=1 Tax=Persicobacter psychrovividus TaxID=387638 RepID=A0ABM7VL10_9BACT|nr:hypothetical protein PEPS_39820 [Persicobacter psychrovividus]
MEKISKASNHQYWDAKWIERYEELKAFYEEHGHSKVPHGDAKFSKLYLWCKNQRRFSRTRSVFSQEKRDLLEAINFDWGYRTADKFEENIGKLIDYKEKYGTTHVSQTLWPRGSDLYKLSRFVNEQRRLYKENRMPLDRIKRLEDIGFSWNVLEDYWEKMFLKMKRFYKKHGHFNVPTSEKKLYAWMYNQIKRTRTPLQLQALESINFPFELKRERLKNALSEMEKIDIKRQASEFKSRKRQERIENEMLEEL